MRGKPAVGAFIQRDGVANLIDGADLQMILQIAANPWQMMGDINAMRLQQLCWADARQLHDVWAANRPCRRDDRAIGRSPISPCYDESAGY